MKSIQLSRANGTALAAALCLCFAAAVPARAATPPLDAAHETWRAAIAETPLPQEGCFTADYPSRNWRPVACKTAPNRPYLPARGARHGRTVGDGADYQAVTTGLISSGIGLFPSVTGVKSETGYNNQRDTYSLQLNSNFFKSAVCNGAATPSSCLGWEQFVYSNSYGGFIQYWLINYGPNCPTSGGWMAYSGDCYSNSVGVTVPPQTITQLGHLKLTAKAVKNGIDTFTFTTASSAYSLTARDSVVDLAAAWQGIEFNIVGDGNGSAAKFNTGSKLVVQIDLKDGGTAAPACKADDGTTGETNNLTLGVCTVHSGTTPFLNFIEKN